MVSIFYIGNIMFPENYSELYARYVQSTRLLTELEFECLIKPGLRVLDVGAGRDLRASRWMIEHGVNNITAVDPCLVDCDVDVDIKKMTLSQYWLQYWNSTHSFDLIVCQQGVNYWFDSEHVNIVCDLLDMGGKFVFDTFNTKPDSVPQFRSYEFGGRQYGEAYQLVGDTVHHWQMCDGLIPHYSCFRWIESEEFESELKRWFSGITRKRFDKTDIYICSKD